MKIFTPEELNNRNKVLIEIKYILEHLSIQFFLVDGALLGAVRDNNFIKWDWDVELAVLAKDVIDKIDNIIIEGETNNFRVEVPDRTLENIKINYYKYNSKSSIVSLIKKNKYLQRKLFKYPAIFFDNPITLEFLGEFYLVPSPVEDFLEFVYGPDWRIPKMSNNKREYLSPEIFRESYMNIIRYKIKKYYNKLF